MSGDNTAYQQGVYGNKGVADAANSPGGRNAAVSWIDASGNLYVFGGNGYATFGSGALNDLWKFATVPSTLPVSLLDFSARKQQQAVLLSWSTASEQASAYFSIERFSKEGAYEEIGRVRAAGTASTVTAYQFTDVTPLKGDNRYRLKQVDRDGKFTYSGVVRVVMADEAVQLRVVENPVRDAVNISLQLEQGQKVTLEIRDAGGRLMLQKEQFFPKGTSRYSMSLAGFPNTTYIVSAITQKGLTSKPFSKQ